MTRIQFSIVRLACASLLLFLFAAAFASPASAWRIVAALDREGNGLGPSDVEESFGAPGDNVVSVAQSDGYPDNSEIGGSARVDSAQGTLQGSAHAVALPVSDHSLRFVSLLEEELEIDFPSIPISERIVRVRAAVSAGFAATNAATATGIFTIEVNGRRGSVAYSTSDIGGWTVLDQDVGVTITATAGGRDFEIALPDGTSDLTIDVQLEGTASAHGRLVDGTGLADVPAANASLTLQLPPGTTFTSGSGVFLVPEPSRFALALMSACILATLRHRREFIERPR